LGYPITEAQYVFKDTQIFISFHHRDFVDYCNFSLFNTKQIKRLEHDVNGSNARGSSVRACDGANGLSIRRDKP